MQICPMCGASQPAAAERCDQCGAALGPGIDPEAGRLCAVCGYRNPPEVVFCEQCGARLGVAETPPGASEATPPSEPITADWVSALEDLFREMPSEAAPAGPVAEEMPLEAAPAEAAPGGLWPPEEPGGAEEAEEIPEWLRGIAGQPESPRPSAPEEETEPFIFPWAEEEAGEGHGVPFIFSEAAPEAAGTGETPLPPSFLEEIPWPEFPPEAAADVAAFPEAWGPPASESPQGPSGFGERPPASPTEPAAAEIGPFLELPPEIEGVLTAPEAAPPEPWGAEVAPLPPEAEMAGPFVFEEAPSPPAAPAEVPPFTEMPEWLQALQPVPEEGAEALEAPGLWTAPTVEETRGPLAGLVDVIPFVPALVAVHGPGARLHAEPAPERQARAQAWKSLLDQGLAFMVGERAARTAPLSLKAMAERWLLTALILGVLILALYWPLSLFQPTGLAAPTAFLQALDQVPDSGVVLVAVDYGPDRAAELEGYLEGALRRLSARGVSLVAVSLSPWGALQAAQILAASPDYGQRVVHLGYLPGEEVAVARLLSTSLDRLPGDYRGRSLQTFPMAATLGTEPLGRRVNLVLLITGSPEALRAWAQQSRPLLPREVPVIAAVGANLAPFVAPYVESGQIQAVAVGLRDALLLEGPAAEGSPAFFDLQAQSALQVLTILLIGVGLTVNLFQPSRRRGGGR